MKKSSIPTIISCISIATLFVSGSIAIMTNASADDLPSVDDTVNITVDSACTMGQTVTSAHTTELNPGETNTTIGQSRIAAYCNDAEGYAIYAIGYTNGEYGNTSLVSTDGNHTIPTGTSGSNSYWNMKLTQGTASGTTSYLPTMVNEFTTNATIPNDYTKVAYRDSSTISQNQDPTITGSYFTTTYSAHIGTTQPAGIYNGQVQYVMVHPSSAPKPEIPNISQLSYMQDFASLSTRDKKTILASMSVDQQYTLIDSRDNKTYYVSKMKDGKVWMTQNLDLELDSNKIYTPADTDVSADWQPARSTIEFTGATVDGWTNDNHTPSSASPGELYVYTSGSTADDVQYSSLTACRAAHIDCSAHNRVGNYYNWFAAVASNDTNVTELTTHNNAPDSVCPAGWRLPISNPFTVGEWEQLLYAEDIITRGGDYTSKGSKKIRTWPLWLVRSGDIYEGGSLIARGIIGYYWTSGAVAPYFTAGGVILSSYSGRYRGLSVRCLLRQP